MDIESNLNSECELKAPKILSKIATTKTKTTNKIPNKIKTKKKIVGEKAKNGATISKNPILPIEISTFNPITKATQLIIFNKTPKLEEFKKHYIRLVPALQQYEEEEPIVFRISYIYKQVRFDVLSDHDLSTFIQLQKLIMKYNPNDSLSSSSNSSSSIFSPIVPKKDLWIRLEVRCINLEFSEEENEDEEINRNNKNNNNNNSIIYGGDRDRGRSINRINEDRENFNFKQQQQQQQQQQNSHYPIASSRLPPVKNPKLSLYYTQNHTPSCRQALVQALRSIGFNLPIICTPVFSLEEMFGTNDILIDQLQEAHSISQLESLYQEFQLKLKKRGRRHESQYNVELILLLACGWIWAKQKDLLLKQQNSPILPQLVYYEYIKGLLLLSLSSSNSKKNQRNNNNYSNNDENEEEEEEEEEEKKEKEKYQNKNYKKINQKQKIIELSESDKYKRIHSILSVREQQERLVLLFKDFPFLLKIIGQHINFSILPNQSEIAVFNRAWFYKYMKYNIIRRVCEEIAESVTFKSEYSSQNKKEKAEQEEEEEEQGSEENQKENKQSEENEDEEEEKQKEEEEEEEDINNNNNNNIDLERMNNVARHKPVPPYVDQALAILQGQQLNEELKRKQVLESWKKRQKKKKIKE